MPGSDVAHAHQPPVFPNRERAVSVGVSRAEQSARLPLAPQCLSNWLRAHHHVGLAHRVLHRYYNVVQPVYADQLYTHAGADFPHATGHIRQRD